MKQKEETQRTRREYAANGERNQTMMSFRLDKELSDWLSQQGNKGRYINNLIKADMMAHQSTTTEEKTIRAMYETLLENLLNTIQDAWHDLDSMPESNLP